MFYGIFFKENGRNCKIKKRESRARKAYIFCPLNEFLGLIVYWQQYIRTAVYTLKYKKIQFGEEFLDAIGSLDFKLFVLNQ